MGDPIELTELNLRISAEYRHHHSDLVLARYPEIESEVRSLVSGTHAVVASSRTRSGVSREGLTATSLNESLKGAFVEAGRWGFEATVEDGIIFDSTSLATSREGFDLARYDISSNLAGLWSLCFGRRPVSDGRPYGTERPADGVNGLTRRGSRWSKVFPAKTSSSQGPRPRSSETSSLATGHSHTAISCGSSTRMCRSTSIVRLCHWRYRPHGPPIGWHRDLRRIRRHSSAVLEAGQSSIWVLGLSRN